MPKSSLAQRVLIVEDERKLARLLMEYLSAAGYDASSVADGAMAVPEVRTLTPDLIILDLYLPRKDGIAICKEVRAFAHTPIIMLTARVDEIDRLLGLEMGADDYICKPFSPREVVARVRAVLRRSTGSCGSYACATRIIVDASRYEAVLDGKVLGRRADSLHLRTGIQARTAGTRLNSHSPCSIRDEIRASEKCVLPRAHGVARGG